MANIPTNLNHQEIKVIIKKFKALYPNRNGPGDWGKYYACEKIIFTPGIEFTTEAEFAYYIYKKFGEGRYTVLAWRKGHEGFWKYFLGNVMENGWVRDKNKNREMERLKVELNKANNYEDRGIIEEEIDFEREITEVVKSSKYSQCLGLIKYNASVLHSYDEPIPIRRVKNI